MDTTIFGKSNKMNNMSDIRTLDFLRENSLQLNTIYNCNCIDGLKLIPDRSIGLVLTDPPYGISSEMKNTRSKNTMKFSNGDKTPVDMENWDKFKNTEEFMEFTYGWVDEIARVLRPGGMFISYFDRDKINFLSDYLKKNGFRSKGYYADCKTNPVPQARCCSWMSSWEMAGLWCKNGGKLAYNYGEGQHKDYGFRPIVCGPERTEHPTQKPLAVFQDFVRWWSNQDDIVLDPFLGSGTTVLASEIAKRNWIGMEVDSKYCEIALNRVLKEQNQLKLF